VALLAGHVRPLRAPRTGALLPPDERGPSLRLTGPDGTQRVWLDPPGRPLTVEWTEVKNPLRVTFIRAGDDAAAAGGPRAIRLVTPDASGRVGGVSRPAVDTGSTPRCSR
jgi:hypothetical protein